MGEADHGLTTAGTQEAQDEDVHGGDDGERNDVNIERNDDGGQRNDVGESEERQKQSRSMHLVYTLQLLLTQR